LNGYGRSWHAVTRGRASPPHCRNGAGYADAVEELSPKFPDGLQVRIGLLSGPAVAEVIGNNKLFYDVLGETVNTASRMESHGEPGRIQVTVPAYEELKGDYKFEERGVVNVKGMGAVETWWLNGRRASE